LNNPTPFNERHPARILIVDDHPNSAEMLARVLARLEQPVEVATAASGEQALQLVDERPVDILITDFMMPGLNGLELIERLSGERKPAYTILMTAYDTPGLAITARRLHVQDYLVKPVQPEKLRAIVGKAVADLCGPSSDKPNAVPARQARILVADDYPDNLRLLSTRLHSEGYVFLTARDGEEILRLLRTEKPDLLLLDINLPKKDGFEVLVEMRADPELALIPVIVVTAVRIGPRDVREGLSLGADDYVIKPFDWRELAARIQSKLRVKFAEDDLRRRARELDVLPEISMALGAEHDLESVAGVILERSVAALQAGGARLDIYLSVDEVYSRRFWADVKRITGGETTAEESRSWGVNGLALSSGQAVVVEDISCDRRWQSGYSSREAAAVAAPLVSRGRVLGILTLTHSRVGHFSQRQAQLLQALAGMAAVAVENTLLYGRLELAADMLRTPLMTVQGYSELLSQMDGLSPQAVEFSDQIASAAQQMKDLVWRLLAVQVHEQIGG